MHKFTPEEVCVLRHQGAYFYADCGCTVEVVKGITRAETLQQRDGQFRLGVPSTDHRCPIMQWFMDFKMDDEGSRVMFHHMLNGAVGAWRIGAFQR